MISRSDLEAYSRTNRQLAEMAKEEMTRYFPIVDFLDTVSQAALVSFAIALINTFGQAMAQNAGRFFTSQTGKESVDVSKVIQEVILTDDFRKRLNATVGFALAAAAAGAIQRGLNAMNEKVEVTMKEIPAQVMEENARVHHVRYARVPTGPETCEFCTVLASQGYVYWSEKSAGRFNEWHEFCDCEVVASNEPIEGYDPKVYLDEYKQAEKIISPGCWERWEKLTPEEQKYFENFSGFKTKSILAQMRKMRSGAWDGNPVVPQIKS